MHRLISIRWSPSCELSLLLKAADYSCLEKNRPGIIQYGYIKFTFFMTRQYRRWAWDLTQMVEYLSEVVQSQDQTSLVDLTLGMFQPVLHHWHTKGCGVYILSMG